MELNIFMKELESALVKRGIPSEVAHKHVIDIRRTFTSEDLSEIQSIQDKKAIEALADNISVIIKKQTKQVPPAAPGNAHTPPAPGKPAEKPVPQRPQNQGKPTPPPKEHTEFDVDEDFFGNSVEKDSTSKGMTIFWVGLFVTLPITLSLLVLIFGTFAGLFVGLVGSIVLGILLLIALVAAGSILALVGLIFGVTQLFSFSAAGIYEIGLGIMIAGIVLFVSVLLYNMIIRFIPWLIKKVAKLLVYVCGKLKELFYFVRRECYKL